MYNKHRHFLLSVITTIFVVFGCRQAIAMAGKPKLQTTNNDIALNTTPKDQATGPIQFCPQSEQLIKKDNKWVTKDNKWESFTHSSATKILGFLGAQWVGVKIGKIICLYQTNEAVAFPLALEQHHSQPVLAPSKYGWSALANNRKFCKSASVADCAYFTLPQKDSSNIYKEIEYNPSESW